MNRGNFSGGIFREIPGCRPLPTGRAHAGPLTGGAREFRGPQIELSVGERALYGCVSGHPRANDIVGRNSDMIFSPFYSALGGGSAWAGSWKFAWKYCEFPSQRPEMHRHGEGGPGERKIRTFNLEFIRGFLPGYAPPLSTPHLPPPPSSR